MLKQPNSRTKKHRGDIDADLVEVPSIQALLDGVSAMHPNRLSAGGGFRLFDSAFDAVCHEPDSRVRSWPPGRDLMSKHEGWTPRVISAPSVSDLECASSGEHRTEFRGETMNMRGARTRHLERHRIGASGVDFDVSGSEVPVKYFGYSIVRVRHVTID